MGVFFTYEGLKYLGLNATTLQGLSSFNAVAASGSALLSNVSSYAGLQVGQLIESSVLAAGTYIVGLDNESGTITLSQPANSSTPSSQTSYFVVGGVFTQNLNLTIHLGQGTLPTGPDSTIANITEANYDGYVPQQVAGPVIINTPPPRDYTCWQYERLVFQPTDYVVQNSITGHYWTYTPPGSTTPVLVAIEPYPASVPLMFDGDILTFNPTLSFAFDSSAGPSSPGIP